MDFATWLGRWLSSHPLKAPPAFDRAPYITEVMGRVKALGRPGSSRWPAVHWLLWPRLALAATAAAAALLMVGRVQPPARPLAEQLVDDAQLLAALEEPLWLAPAADGEDVEGLAHELETMDTLLLAEAPPSDEAWIEQTLQLLEALDEDPPEELSGEASSDEWLDELQWLDERELAASS